MILSIKIFSISSMTITTLSLKEFTTTTLSITIEIFDTLYADIQHDNTEY